ncbi:TraY domain-containing protein [Butyricicoccus sp. 1XD8-22]|nr:TraY domain-containing protein [Butyricicoccus sp. 1XD8-22]
MSGFTLRIKDSLMRKFRYLCSYEHRSANQQLLKMIEETVRQFEEANGEITEDLLQEFFRDNQDK